MVRKDTSKGQIPIIAFPQMPQNEATRPAINTNCEATRSAVNKNCEATQLKRHDVLSIKNESPLNIYTTRLNA